METAGARALWLYRWKDDDVVRPWQARRAALSTALSHGSYRQLSGGWNTSAAKHILYSLPERTWRPITSWRAFDVAKGKEDRAA